MTADKKYDEYKFDGDASDYESPNDNFFPRSWWRNDLYINDDDDNKNNNYIRAQQLWIKSQMEQYVVDAQMKQNVKKSGLNSITLLTWLIDKFSKDYDAN